MSVRKWYGYKEAAAYLNIPEQEFLAYVNEKAALAYRLFITTRMYEEKELDRFKKEVLNMKGKG